MPAGAKRWTCCWSFLQPGRGAVMRTMTRMMGLAMRSMTIGKAAGSAGVNVETIRFYERKGLIEQPPKSGRAYRQYSETLVAEVRFIKEAQRLGFSLGEIRGLLQICADRRSDCADVQSRVLAKKREVEGKIERLQRLDAALGRLITECPGSGGIERCPILGSLSQTEPSEPQA